MEYIWNITGRCNLKCEHCWDKFKFETDISTTKAKLLVDELIKNGCKTIIFTGGEPLLREDFFVIAEYASKKGIKNIKLCTNGILIKKRIDELIDSPINEIHISLDDTVDTRYRKHTEFIKENIELLVDRLDLSKVKVVLVSVLDMDAIYKFENVIIYAQNLGINSSYQFPCLLNHNTLSDYAVSSYPKERINEVISSIQGLYEKYNKVLDYFSKFYIEKAKKYYLEGASPNVCGAGKQFKVISPSGEFWDCYINKKRVSDNCKCFEEQCLIWARSDERAERIIKIIESVRSD